MTQVAWVNCNSYLSSLVIESTLMPAHKSTQIIKVEEDIEQEVESLIDHARVVGFSDAVFAFAATLLVLKIDLPELSSVDVNTQLPAALFLLWPQYFANIVSFLLIGYYWINHHALFGMLRKYNMTMVWLNLVFLICISFLPFPVDLFGSYSTVPAVVMFYAGSLAVAGTVMALMWWYAAGPGKLVDPAMGSRKKRYYFLRIIIAPVVFAISIPLVNIDHGLARGSWLLIILGIIWINQVYKYKHLSRIEEMLG